MRIIIHMDAIRERGKRLRIRTRYDFNTKDGAQHAGVQNAMLSFYGDLTTSIREALDTEITEFIDEGEKR